MPPRIFISYSHDTNAHVERVLSLADRLRAEGLDVHLDQYIDSPPEGWTRWMQRQIEEADFVLLVCSATYRTRFDGKATAGTGKGVTWEGFLATQLLYDAQSLNTRFVPVFFFADGTADDIPLPLRPATHYRLPDRYDDLYRRLMGQPKTQPPPLGASPTMTLVARPRLISTSGSSPTAERHDATSGQQIDVARPVAYSTSSAAQASPPPAVPTSTSPTPAEIVLFTANAADPDRQLALENELRVITDALQRSRMRDCYDLRISPAITFPQLIHDLDDRAPRFVHFVGHGASTGALVLKTADFQDTIVTVENLRQLFAEQRIRPQLVVFGTCYSRDLAAAISPHVSYAIGFTGPLQDRAAPTFSAVLYERLAAHDPPDIPRAFRLARLATISAGYPEAEQACLFDHAGATL